MARRLVKNNRILAGGGYFFALINAIISVTMIDKIMQTTERISKSLMRRPSFQKKRKPEYPGIRGLMPSYKGQPPTVYGSSGIYCSRYMALTQRNIHDKALRILASCCHPAANAAVPMASIIAPVRSAVSIFFFIIQSLRYSSYAALESYVPLFSFSFYIHYTRGGGQNDVRSQYFN